jgi:TrmH family RNA methyltransferase
MRTVQGQKDPVIALLRDLVNEAGRKRHGLFFAEGEELARRAFDYGGQVKAVLLTERFAGSAEGLRLLQTAQSGGVEAHVLTEGLLSKVLDAKPTPECLVISERKVCSLADALAGDAPLVQLVEHGENADNLGMLLRSCDAAGATGVVLAADTTDPFSRRVVRGSRGAVFTLPVCISNDPARAIETARKRGIQVIASSAQSETSYTAPDYTKPTMLIVGNEHVGISQTVREMADEVVRIPMLGRINSLNIAVAASILLYEAVRQRQN